MIFLCCVRFVNVTVEGGEAAEKGYADQVLDPLDVLVKIYQRVDRLDFSDGLEQFRHVHPPFSMLVNGGW